MSDEVKDENLENEDKENESPEQKATKIDKQYMNEMAFIAKVLGSDTAINTPKTVEGDTVATVVAKMFKDREEKLTEEVAKGLNDLVELHMKSEAAIREDENKLKQKRTAQRKEFIKVAKAWKAKINQQSVQKAEYAATLQQAIEATKGDDTIHS